MSRQLFGISSHGSRVRTEIIAGVTTYLTMVYIIFVNPEILSQIGRDRTAVMILTIAVGFIFGPNSLG